MAEVISILTLAAIYAIYASGFTLVFGFLQVLNLSHATVFSFSAVLVIYSVYMWHAPLWLAVILGIIGGGVAGLVAERIAFRPIRYRSDTSWSKHMGPMITSLGVASILTGVSNVWFGTNPIGFPDNVLSGTFSIAGARISQGEIVVIATVIVVFGALTLLLNRTRWGLEVRAVADRSDAVSLVGVSAERKIIEVFGLAGMLGGLTGVLWTLQFNNVAPDTLADQMNTEGFAIIVLGGMGSVPGAVVGAVFLATVETLSVLWLPNNWQTVVPYVALFVMLIVRPQGILGRRLASDRA